MNVKLLAIGAVVALLLAGTAVAFVTGFGPMPGDDSGDSISEFPTETPTGDSDGATGDTNESEDSTTSTPPFAFTVDSIEKCGQTCRDVTSTLSNQQDHMAEDVTVYTRIYAGNGTDGDVVWEGTEDVGQLAAGSSYTTTRRVELSYGDAYAVEQEDGWITVQTTVETANQTVTFTEQRNVG